VVCAETAISLTRARSPRRRDRTSAADTAAEVTRTAKRTRARTATRTPAADTGAAVRAALATDPEMATSQVAAMTGVSDRTVRRVRAAMNGAATTT
jgi:hypothetical protein